MNLNFKNGCKNEIQVNKKNHAADSEIGSPQKSILESKGLRSKWMTVMSSIQTRALFHIYIIIKSNFGVLNDFWCNGDFGFGMVPGERQRAARREGAREPHGAKNAPPNHEHQIDHHTLNLIISLKVFL